MNVRKEDREQIVAILSEAGSKGKELANAINSRKSLEIHLHFTGPVVIGSDVARDLLPLLAKIHDTITKI